MKKTLLSIVLLTIGLFSFAQEEGVYCETAYNPNISEQITCDFEEEQQDLYVQFNPDQGTIEIELHEIPSADFPELNEYKLYEFNDCEELTEVANGSLNKIADMDMHLYLLDFLDLDISKQHLLKLIRDDNFDLVPTSTDFIIYGATGPACPSYSSNNLIKNGGFEDHLVSRIQGWNDFEKGQICEWGKLNDYTITPDVRLIGANHVANLVTHNRAGQTWGDQETIIIDNPITFDNSAQYVLTFKAKSESTFPSIPDADGLIFSLFPNFTSYPTPLTDFKLYPNQIVLSDITTFGANFTTHYTAFTGNSGYDKLVIYPYTNSHNPNLSAGNLEWKGVNIDDVAMYEWKISIPPTVATCADDRTIGPTDIIPEAVYSWSPTAGLSNPNIPNPTANPTTLTTYTVTVTYPNLPWTISPMTASVDVEPSIVLSGLHVIDDLADVDWIKASPIPYTGGTSSPVFITGQSFFVKGLLTIDKDITFEDCEFIMATDSRIEVNSGAELIIADSDNLMNEIKTCEPNEFWDGIFVDGASNSNIQLIGDANFSDEDRYLKISNMRYGINVTDLSNNYNVATTLSDAFLKNVEFDRNMRCIELDNSNVTSIVAGNSAPGIDIFSLKIDCSSPLVDGGAPFYPEYSIKIFNFIDPNNTSSIQFSATYAGVQMNRFTGSLRSEIDAKAGGIYSYNSHIKILRTDFIEFNNYSSAQPIKNTYAVKVINNTGPISSSGDYTWTNIESNNFIQCLQGVYLQGNSFFSIQSNEVNYDGTTYYPWHPSSSFIHASGNYLNTWIGHNKVYNVTQGVLSESCTQLLIYDNTFDMEKQSGTDYTSKLNYNSFAIVARNLSNYLSSITIDNNTIKHSKLGVQVWFANALIIDNTIEDMNNVFVQQSNCPPWGCATPAPAYGIRVLNAEQNFNLSNNTVINTGTHGNNTQGDIRVIGISLENSLSVNNVPSQIRCNKTENTGIGLQFSGSNDIATGVFRNNMKNNYYGFQLANNGFIGDVGSSGNAADNTWNGSFGFSETFADNSDGSMCTLYVQSSGVFNPLIQANHSTAGSNTIQKSSGHPAATNVGCSAIARKKGTSTPTGNSSNGNGLAQQAAKGQMNYMKHAADSATKLNQQLLYWQLSKDSTASADSTWQTFADSMKNTSMGKAMGKNSRAVSTSTDNFDVNYNAIAAIQLKLEQDTTLTRQDSIEIGRIAMLCPYYDGIAVYFARNILLTMGYGNIVNDCEISQKVSQGKVKRLAGEVTETDLVIYPNPAQNQINFNFTVAETETVELIVLDVLGKLQKRVLLQPVNQHQIDVSDLKGGVYMYQLVHLETVTHSGKLILH